MDQAIAPPTVGRVKEPRQARSARTLARLEEAALDLIRSHGLEGVSVQSVVKAAGSSVGSFYARFASKDDLLDHLRTRAQARAVQEWEARAMLLENSDEGVEGFLREVCETVVSTFGGAGREALLLGGSSGPQPVTVATAMAASLEDLLPARVEPIHHPDPALAIRVCVRTIVAMGRDLAEASMTSGDTDLSREILVEELALGQLRYLGVGLRSSEGETANDPFDIWG